MRKRTRRAAETFAGQRTFALERMHAHDTPSRWNRARQHVRRDPAED